MNKQFIRISKGISFILLILLLAACTSTRKIIKAPLKDEGVDFLFSKLKENELHFDQVSAKFNLDYIIDKKKTSFKGQIRIKKDSLIWVSFSPALGIEMARLLISQDSVKFINRIKKTYFKGDYDYLNAFFDVNIDFDILQALIIGNDLNHYENGKFRASIDNMMYRLSTADRRKLKKYVRSYEKQPKVFIQHIWLDPELFKISRQSLKEIQKENKKLEVDYYKFMDLDGQLIPANLYFHLIADTKIDVDVKYTKISKDESMKFPFKVTKKYQQITKIK